LIEQLKPGGRLVMPVGEAGEPQVLVLVEKAADGQIHTRNITPVVFVPLTRQPQR
jgi:protein-L-isoaspartate(D-aspartate) O-methyltransferase